MYTTTVGKTFLKEYNRRHGTEHSAEAFFDKVMFPLFFDSNKYMIWAQNTPITQMKGKQKVHNLSKEERHEKLIDLHTKIDAGIKDFSVAIGYPAAASEKFATTSGTITDLDFEIEFEDGHIQEGITVPINANFFWPDVEL